MKLFFLGDPRLLDRARALGMEIRGPPVDAPGLVYATGTGATQALAMRARGELWAQPLILQGIRGWRRKPFLRDLDRHKLQRIEAWWGGRDRITRVRSLQRLQAALQTNWTLRYVPHWGHKPMVHHAEEWVAMVRQALERL